jgi:hypothetical protein
MHKSVIVLKLLLDVILDTSRPPPDARVRLDGRLTHALLSGLS